MIFYDDVIVLLKLTRIFWVDGMNEKYQKLFEKMVKFFKPGDVMSELAANGNTISCEIQKT